MGAAQPPVRGLPVEEELAEPQAGEASGDGHSRRRRARALQKDPTCRSAAGVTTLASRGSKFNVGASTAAVF